MSVTDLTLWVKIAEAKRLRVEAQRLRSKSPTLPPESSHLKEFRGTVETPIDHELKRTLAQHFDEEEIRTLLNSALFQQVAKETPRDIERTLLAGLEIMSWGRSVATRPPIRPTTVVSGHTTVV